MEENDLIEIKTSLLTLGNQWSYSQHWNFPEGIYNIYGPDCFIRGYWTQGEIRRIPCYPKGDVWIVVVTCQKHN
jgi:hypothetical protein